MPASRANHPLNQSALYKLRSRSKLAALLAISPSELRRLTKSDQLYREFEIEKKGGGTRLVENPARPLKLAQARLARLLSRITPPDYLFCPVKGRCYVSNAAQHLGNRVVRCLDVRKYFPSTSSRRVFWFFTNIMKCERDVAGLLTALASYNQHLPTGSPLSPIMAYFAHYDVWEKIAAFCRDRGYTLTVYVDDCTVSGKSVPQRDMWEIRRLIHGSGLRYHKEKAYFDKPAEITGVIVRGKKLSPPHRQFQKLRSAKLELAKATAHEAVSFGDQIKGLSGQIQQIEDINLRQ